MKHTVYKARHARPQRREYFNGSRVGPVEADAIRTLGGKVTDAPDDKEMWRMGS